MRIYLAGPMTGYKDFNFPAFRAAANLLREDGYEVFSPHEQGWGNGDPHNGKLSKTEYKRFIAEDLRQVALSEVVVVLPGWEESKGASLETHVADALDIPVLTIEEALMTDGTTGRQRLPAPQKRFHPHWSKKRRHRDKYEGKRDD